MRAGRHRPVRHTCHHSSALGRAGWGVTVVTAKRAVCNLYHKLMHVMSVSCIIANSTGKARNMHRHYKAKGSPIAIRDDPAAGAQSTIQCRSITYPTVCGYFLKADRNAGTPNTRRRSRYPSLRGPTTHDCADLTKLWRVHSLITPSVILGPMPADDGLLADPNYT